MDNNNTKQLEVIVKALDSKRGEDIKAVGIRDLTIIADCFVIAAGSSTTQVKALADAVEFELKQKCGISPARVEGYSSANWIILDYSDIVVHIFYNQTRQFYNLEKLWADGEDIDVSEYLSAD